MSHGNGFPHHPNQGYRQGEMRNPYPSGPPRPYHNGPPHPYSNGPPHPYNSGPPHPYNSGPPHPHNTGPPQHWRGAPPYQDNWSRGGHFGRDGRGGRGGHSSKSGVNQPVKCATAQAAQAAQTTVHCESCDKEFPSEAQRQAHFKTHEVCEHEGCNFEGTRKVLSAHFQSKHGKFSGSGMQQVSVEGQQFMVLLGSDPKEIEEWREERRRKWPSARVIAAKQAMEEREVAEGGLSHEPRRGKKRQRNKHAANATGWLADSAWSTPSAPRGVTTTSQAGHSDTQGAACKAKAEGVVEQPANEIKEENALSSLVGYGESDSDEGGQEVEHEANANANANANAKCSEEPSRKRACVFFQRGKCNNGDKCKFSHVAQQQVGKPCQYFLKGRCRKGTRCTFQHDKALRSQAKQELAEGRARVGEGRSRPTLLKMLLRKELRKESSRILQCFRLLVETDFLQSEGSAEK
ncbi:unnamed protein product [Chrysoparadoxa australica]